MAPPEKDLAEIFSRAIFIGYLYDFNYYIM